jgi:hypothetical protein
MLRDMLQQPNGDSAPASATRAPAAADTAQQREDT